MHPLPAPPFTRTLPLSSSTPRPTLHPHPAFLFIHTTDLAIQPNAEHTLFNRIEELSSTLQAFMYTINERVARPKFTWSMNDNGTVITVNSVDTPLSVRVFTAYNENRGRAFILNCYLSCVWRATELPNLGNNTFVATVPVPAVGYAGFFVEISYDIAPNVPALVVTTGVSIVPQTLPFGPCGDACAACDTCEPLTVGAGPRALSA